MIKTSEIVIWVAMSLFWISKSIKKNDVKGEEQSTLADIGMNTPIENSAVKCLDMNSNFYGGLPLMNKKKNQSYECRRKEDRRYGV